MHWLEKLRAIGVARCLSGRCNPLGRDMSTGLLRPRWYLVVHDLPGKREKRREKGREKWRVRKGNTHDPSPSICARRRQCPPQKH
uniref:Uncharacterized protein n=1 Tax=Physcomitrium patens TaxID=3218 RepID=A0A2K1K5Y6_PHYPA|nr:hypothetical protein PHYPA_011080 [Physcomitrium patens]